MSLAAQGEPDDVLVKQFQKQNEELLYIITIPGHSGGDVQPNFFTQQQLPNNFAKELYHMSVAKIENAIKERGLVPAGLKQEDMESISHSSILATRILIPNSKLTSF